MRMENTQAKSQSSQILGAGGVRFLLKSTEKKLRLLAEYQVYNSPMGIPSLVLIHCSYCVLSTIRHA